MFTHQQRLRALVYLSAFHIFIIIISNYLVQYPFEVFGLHTTWGAVTFPFIFLATDLTVRIFGAVLARRIIFLVMLPALVISYVISCLFLDTVWQGWSSLTQFNLDVARVSLASFLAYSVGQVMDVHVFNRLRHVSAWWVAPSASMFLGNLVDTFLFFFVAFYASSNTEMADHWVQIAQLDYAFKILICFIFFLPAYGVLLKRILKKLLKPTQDMLEPSVAAKTS